MCKCHLNNINRKLEVEHTYLYIKMELYRALADFGLITFRWLFSLLQVSQNKLLKGCFFFLEFFLDMTVLASPSPFVACLASFFVLYLLILKTSLSSYFLCKMVNIKTLQHSATHFILSFSEETFLLLSFH